MAIHAVPSGLLDVAACRKGRAAIEHADIVEAQEAALEHVHAFGVPLRRSPTR